MKIVIIGGTGLIGSKTAERLRARGHEISGPERARLCDFVARYLKAVGDARTVVADPEAKYFGTKLDDDSLVSNDARRIGHIGFDQWFAATSQK